MAANHQEAYTLNASVQSIGDLINSGDFAAQCKLKLHAVNPTNDGVCFRLQNGANFRSWGEKITITLVAAGPDATYVTIRSECSLPTQVVDWGKNKEHVSRVRHYLTSHLPNGQYQQPQYQQPVYAQPAPQQVPEAPRFCSACGKAVTPGDCFCSGCGAKLQ